MKAKKTRHFSGRFVRENLKAIALRHIANLANFTYENQIEGCIKDLSSIAAAAHDALLTLSRGSVIMQAELQAAVDAYKAWEASGATEYPPSYIEAARIRNAKFKAGWGIEPGKWGMRISEDGLFWIFNRQWQTIPTMPHAQRPDTPRASRPFTPTPAQLQAWFDLPSEPPHAEGSPAGS